MSDPYDIVFPLKRPKLSETAKRLAEEYRKNYKDETCAARLLDCLLDEGWPELKAKKEVLAQQYNGHWAALSASDNA